MFDVTTRQKLTRAMREGRVVHATAGERSSCKPRQDLRPSAKAWFRESAKVMHFAQTQSGFYDDVLSFLNLKK